ncbi:cilia- and flagella-associated protein 43-like [Amia ocellicauda]|uniref:cilia- and flagella-associated protein 43-like n=1 Tax=Amia ocellicauda TaxID=2972642 RepID=UPI003464E7F3
MFEVIGYTEAAGSVVDLSSLYNKDSKQVNVLVLSAGNKENCVKEGSCLEIFMLQAQLLKGGCADRRGCIRDEILQKRHYAAAQPLSSAVLGPNNRAFGYCIRTRTIQKFLLDEGISDTEDIVQVTPERETEGHALGSASLLLSPHQLWLVSLGKDGSLCVFETSCMRVLELDAAAIQHVYINIDEAGFNLAKRKGR